MAREKHFIFITLGADDLEVLEVKKSKEPGDTRKAIEIVTEDAEVGKLKPGRKIPIRDNYMRKLLQKDVCAIGEGVYAYWIGEKDIQGNVIP